MAEWHHGASGTRRLDLVLHIDDGLLPSHFQSERLYKEDWICAVARASCFGDRLPLKQFLAAGHIVVATYSVVQTIPDKQLAAVGAKCSSCVRVPYFGVALQCLPGTELVLTLTSGMTSVIVTAREGAARIAHVSFPHGVASETQHRSAPHVASSGDAINDREP